MKQKIKEKILKFGNKYEDRLIACLWLLWLLGYALFCKSPSLLLFGVSITCLLVVEFHWVFKKLELRDDIFDSFDRLISYSDAILQQNKNLQKEMTPFRNLYFRNLSTEEIAQLAKTRLAVGSESQDYRHALEDIKEYLNQIDVSNTHISRALARIDEVIDEDIQ